MVNFVRQQDVLSPAIYQQVQQKLDLVNFVDYCLLNVYCAMGDWPANNFRAGLSAEPRTAGAGATGTARGTDTVSAIGASLRTSNAPESFA